MQNDKANALGLLDSGQLGNGERCWRNVAIDSEDVKCGHHPSRLRCAALYISCCSLRACRYNGRFQIPSHGKLRMDVASIASSFGSEGDKGRYGLFNRVEFEEFAAALKALMDGASSGKELEHACREAIGIIRSRLLSGKQLTCKMVRLRWCCIMQLRT